VRSRHRGQFHEIITLDTPELGSELAPFLLTHKDCGRSSASPYWPSFVWNNALCLGVPGPLQTVERCFDQRGLPLGPPGDLTSGAVFSLFPNGPSLQNPSLPGPNIAGADWRAIGSFAPGNSALESFLNAAITAIYQQDIPACHLPLGSLHTIDQILGLGSQNVPNDAIVTLAGQLGGRIVVDPSHKWFSNLSHAPLKPEILAFLLNFVELTNDNVEQSPAVWQQVCQWLSPSIDCPLVRAAATASTQHTERSKKGAKAPPMPPLYNFQADELPVAEIPLVEPGDPNGVRNPTLRLQPWGFRGGARDYLPANAVQFSVYSPGGHPSYGSMQMALFIHSIKERRGLKRSTSTGRLQTGCGPAMSRSAS
jgi:hypothetical protein